MSTVIIDASSENWDEEIKEDFANLKKVKNTKDNTIKKIEFVLSTAKYGTDLFPTPVTNNTDSITTATTNNKITPYNIIFF